MIRNITAFILGFALMAMAMSYAKSEEIILQTGWVTDQAKVLTDQQVKDLSKILAEIERTKPDAPQVVVVTYSSLGDQSISEKTIQLAKAWKVGRKERDNGVVIAIAPKERKYFISVGYGLEPFIPDAKTTAIGDKMRQTLKSRPNDWPAAIIVAVHAVESMLPIEAYDPANPVVKPASKGEPIGKEWKKGWAIIGVMSFLGLIGMIIWAVFFRKTRDQRRSSNRYYGHTGGYSSCPSRRDTSSVVFVPTPSYDPPSRSRSSDDDSSSRSSWSSSSSSDYSSSSSSSDSSSSYSSGGGDSGGGGGGGDF